jgi:hypothetical protein
MFTRADILVASRAALAAASPRALLLGLSGDRRVR